jgi:hypothetical protein
MVATVSDITPNILFQSLAAVEAAREPIIEVIAQSWAVIRRMEEARAAA